MTTQHYPHNVYAREYPIATVQRKSEWRASDTKKTTKIHMMGEVGR